jgi:hypothetical protein
VAKEEGKKEKKETLVASSSADALPPVDLRSSILFFKCLLFFKEKSL